MNNHLSLESHKAGVSSGRPLLLRSTSSRIRQTAQDDRPCPLAGWLSAGADNEVLDYDPRTEALVVVWDDRRDSRHGPSVRLASDPFDEEVRTIEVNGRCLAEIYGDPTVEASDISVLPLSCARKFGLTPR